MKTVSCTNRHQGILPLANSRAKRTDGKNLSTMSDLCWQELLRSAHVFGYQTRPQFVTALTLLVTPKITRTLQFEDLLDALRPAIRASNRDACQAALNIFEDDAGVPANKSLSMPDANWLELRRVAGLCYWNGRPCNDRKEFLEKFTTEITPHFRGLAALPDLIVVVDNLNRRSS